MKKIYFFLILAISLYTQAQLVVNEISQGNAGSREFIEFVVIGTPTCSQPCFDLRGWIIDDNNGFHATGGGTGISAGCLRFRNIAQWACVPYGSIILIYNENDKNVNITLPDDPTDANNDKVYVLPGNSTLLEGNSSSPSVVNGPSYSGLTFTSPGSWNYIIMGNDNDAVHTIAPGNLSSAYFAVGWGNNTNNVNIYFSGSATGRVFFNANSTNNDPFLQSNWTSSPVGPAETPGAPNNAANNAWIQSLRNQVPINQPIFTSRSLCILNGQSIVLGGQPRTTSGAYRDTLTAANGCDSIVTTNLFVNTPVTINIPVPPSCDSFVFQGFVFKKDTIVRDTIRTPLGCDSVYRVANIQIRKSKRDTVNVCINPGQTYFAGGANQSTSGFYTDVFTASNGCDSVRVTRLTVITPITITQNIQACNSFTFKGITYTGNATVRDTVKSYLGCDSIYQVTNIQIFLSKRDTISVCINAGNSYPAGGGLQTAPGFYSDTFATQGCDSIRVVRLSVVAVVNQTQNLTGCGQVIYKGTTYTSNAIVFDTIRTQLGCDSIIRQVNITVNQPVTITRNVCINQGQSFFAGGANQTTSGAYTDTYTAANGCDSTVVTDLDVITIQNTSQNISGCDSVTYNGVVYRQNTTLRDTLRNGQGCITQINTISIRVGNSSIQNRQVCINAGQSYFAGGANQTTSGIYTDRYTNSGGCDSIIITNLDVITIQNSTQDIKGCDSVLFNGVIYRQNTILRDTVRNAQGCITQINTTSILVGKNSTFRRQVCINTGQSFFAGGANQTTSGTYQDIFKTPHGCDSIIITELSVIDINTTNTNLQGCDSLSYNGNTYYQSILISDTTRNASGCITDISNVSITVNYSSLLNVAACINPGETYFAGGGPQSHGIYYDTLTASNGCPEYKITNLRLIVPTTDTLPLITSEEFLIYEGKKITQDTTIFILVKSQGDCDSIFRYQPIKINKVLPIIIYVPNAFTPNSDGVNDIIFPLHSDNVRILEFNIYNRWGELIYSGNTGWDGTYRGEWQKPDVYVYTLKAEEKVSKKIERKTGSITLIK